MKEFRLLDTGKLSAAANMALDEIVLGEVAGGASPPTLRFLQFDPPAALVGYHQDVSHEIRVDFCREHGIEINRRHTGGGAILFQPSALGWEMFGVPGEPPFAGTYEAILFNTCSIAAEGLSRLGIPANSGPATTSRWKEERFREPAAPWYQAGSCFRVRCSCKTRSSFS